MGRKILAFAALAVFGPISAAAADDFFKGKQITLDVGSTPGGPYDAYARMIARHWGRNISGNPSMLVVNMAGASGRRLMGHMYGVAPKDGTEVALVQRALAFDPLMGIASPYDPLKMSWIGSANDETNICIVWHSSPIRTAADLTTMQMVVGSGGPSSTDSIYPNVLNNLFGMKFKVVEGYEAANETQIAMERGEVDGRCGITWDTLQSLKPDWIAEQKIRILLQFALDKHPDLPAVPSVFDLAKTDEQRQILAIWAAPNKMGRPFFGPPGMAPDRLESLRRSFDATMKDPALLQEVAQTRLWVKPITGEQIEKLLKEIYATPKAVVDKAAEASKPK